MQVPFDRARWAARTLLFSSDAPNTGFTIVQALAAVDGLGLTPAQRELVTGGTARRMLAEVAV